MAYDEADKYGVFEKKWDEKNNRWVEEYKPKFYPPKSGYSMLMYICSGLSLILSGCVDDRNGIILLAIWAILSAIFLEFRSRN